MGCHYLDLVFWALDLRFPITIEAEGSPAHSESTPRHLRVRWQFPARGMRPPVTLTWDQNRKRPPFWKEHELPDWAWCVFVGSEGMLLANYQQHLLWPQTRFVDVKPLKPTIPESIGHHQEWIVACKTGSPTTCNFDYSGAVTETVLLGNVAYRCGNRIHWEPENLKIPDVPEAEQFLHRKYRPGWSL
jgi:hypothetical protein